MLGVILGVFAGMGAQRASAAPACTITWDGEAATTAWTTAANWDTNVIPAATDDVCVPDLGAGVEVVHSTGTSSILSLQGTGGVQISGGTLDVTSSADAIDQLVISSGTLGGAGTVRIGTAGTWLGGTMLGTGKTTVDPGATLTLSNNTTLGGGRTLEVGGTFAIPGDMTVSSTGTPGLVHVLAGGLVQKSVGVGSSSINPPIDNDGTVELTTGAGSSLDLPGGSGAATSTGTFGKTGAAGAVRLSDGAHTIGPATFAGGVEISGANVTIPSGTVTYPSLTQSGGGTTTVEGGATLGGPGTTLTLQGGVLQGSGTVGGAVVNDGATVRPGASPGILTIDGAFSQNVGGTLETEVAGVSAGSGYDRLAVGGTAALAGTLAIITPSPFDPPASSAYDVLTAATRVGAFDVVSGTAIPGKHYEVDYQSNRVRLLVPGTGAGPPPANTVAPSIPADAQTGDALACDPGQWTNTPTSFAYSWLRDGTPIPGATTQPYTVASADVGHPLGCSVIAANAGGSSEPVSSNTVIPTAAPPSNDFSFGKLKRDTSKGTARLIVEIPGPGELSLRGRGVVAARSAAGAKAATRVVTGPGKVRLKIRSKGKAKRRLRSTGKVTVRVKVTYTPTGGAANTRSKRVKLVIKRG